MKETIQAFVDDKNIAIAGVSKNKNKFGNILLRALQNKGYTVFPINPNTTTVEGITAYATVKDLPANVANVILAVGHTSALEIAEECKNTAIKRVWLISGAGNNEPMQQVINRFAELNILTVQEYCPMMFFSPKGIHGWHLWIKKILSGHSDKVLEN